MADAQAFQSGWQLVGSALARRRARREALSDEEFEARATRLGDELAANKEMLSKIDRLKIPAGYESKVGDLQRNLSDLRELYHPDRHPNAIAKFGHIVTDRLKITSGKKRVQAEAARRAAGSAEDEQGAQSLAAATPPPRNELVDYRRALVDAGFSPEQAQRALEVRIGIEAKATAEKPEHPTDYEKGFGRFLKGKGVGLGDATAEDEAEYRRSVHPAPVPKPARQSDFQIGFERYLRERGISPAKATAEDERNYRRLIHPPRGLKDLRSEAEKRRPKPKKRHTKAAPPPYDWSADPSHQQPTAQAGPR